jgi:hypothetical protein
VVEKTQAQKKEQIELKFTATTVPHPPNKQTGMACIHHLDCARGPKWF